MPGSEDCSCASTSRCVDCRYIADAKEQHAFCAYFLKRVSWKCFLKSSATDAMCGIQSARHDLVVTHWQAKIFLLKMFWKRVGRQFWNFERAATGNELSQYTGARRWNVLSLPSGWHFLCKLTAAISDKNTKNYCIHQFIPKWKPFTSGPHNTRSSKLQRN